MKNKILILFTPLLISKGLNAQNFKLFEKSKWPIKEIYSGKSSKVKTKYHEFEISEFITVNDYKLFLKAIYKDSGEAFYNQYVPHGSINEKKIIDAFWSDSTFGTQPAIGITWEAAQAYCKWLGHILKTDKNYSYRLPNIHEWCIYSNQSNLIDIKNFGLYSEWTINVMDESLYGIDPKQNSINSYEYEHGKDDPQVFKRKIVLGDNFMEKFEFPIDASVRSYYADEGYRTIGFRVVRTQITEK
jgi:hypothetical protein